ncbi:DUF349 domain-containing protein [Gryllotalpicola protaetiae]|uniref:DUF349 domain-containing protein n=1 Tax=Gryllotalpicola protaetiae TaxID=2419771 RepID=A0A387BVT4_9MICO|nr:DUF349 domain-containing protein [Gryllotalpicola protaetiae]AYG04957.1 DUF349 domain-containing protein [Gryllotalpicola protaetiae]
MSDSQQQPWGRVAEDGTVYVREGDGERAVGEFPGATAEEALAYYERKFADLAGQVSILEQRARRGAPAADVAKSVATLKSSIVGASAVGDLASLEARLDKLGGAVEELTEQQSAEAKAALADALAVREQIVVEVEALAAEDPAKTQWKRTSAQLDELFGRWQQHQKDGPRLPKNEANELWKRFRGARSVIERNRKAFFAELDSQHRDARTIKATLIERAEALVPRGIDGIPQYRELLDEWKRAGRAGKRDDDALWARFKAAGDQIYAAKAEADTIENEEYSANLDAKLALLAEAEPLAGESDRDVAKAKLLDIQRRWDEIGRVPREQVRPIEDRLRRVEAAVRKLDEEHWRANNPEKQARSAGLAAQLTEAIERLESELADAQASGDTKAIADAQEAIDARKAWLNALR